MDLKNICFVIPSWSGPKKIRLAADTYAADRTYKIHELFSESIYEFQKENKKKILFT